MTPVPIPLLFSLPQTLDCGQAFRWSPVPAPDGEDGLWWEGAAGDRFLRLKQEQDRLLLFCSPEEFESFWKNYFDLETDYPGIRRSLSALGPALEEAIAFAPGIRILRQDPWEALCSFLISQNNNIPRIKGIIRQLCERFGTPIPGSGLSGFPGPEVLAGLTREDLSPLHAGYREKYLIDAGEKVASGKISLEEIAVAPAERGRELLRQIAGVGPKVAECVLLYGFHKTECFPMDVWMKRAMAVLLPGTVPAQLGEYAGLAQQYLFHYSRSHPEIFS